MGIWEVFALAKRWWGLVAALVLVGAGAGVGQGYFVPRPAATQYQTTYRVVVSGFNLDLAPNGTTDLAAYIYTAAWYETDLNKIDDAVLAVAGPDDLKEISESVKAYALTGRHAFDIVCEWSDQDVAEAIVTILGQAVEARLLELVPESDSLVFTSQIVRETVDGPSAASHLRSTAVGGVLGLVLGVGVACLLYLRRSTLLTAAMIADFSGLGILADLHADSGFDMLKTKLDLLGKGSQVLDTPRVSVMDAADEKALLALVEARGRNNDADPNPSTVEVVRVDTPDGLSVVAKVGNPIIGVRLGRTSVEDFRSAIADLDQVGVPAQGIVLF